jgi:beta-galactosidase
VLDANGRVGRRYEEVCAVAAELESLRERLAGARPHADVALLHDCYSRFALQVQPTNPVLAYEETVQQHYESLRRLGLGVDVVPPQAALSAYRVVVAPELFVMDEAICRGAHRLRRVWRRARFWRRVPASRTVGTRCRSGRLRSGSTSLPDSSWSTT